MMIWATVAEIRTYRNAAVAADPGATWPELAAADAAVQTLIESAARRLAGMVIRWPVLDDEDRAEDTVQRGHLVAAVAETIRGRLRASATDAALGGMSALIAAGGKIKADNLEITGAAGAVVGETRTIPVDALDALAAAGLIGGSVPTW
jgi:hypothetical protein